LISQFRQSGSIGVLTFSGALTVKHIGEMRNIFIRTLMNFEHIEMDISAVTDIDLFCLQLLCSLHRTSLGMNKRVDIIGSQPANFRETLEEAGYSRVTGCGLDREHGCFWIAR
jgi:anti-anti-sigma regulatory factor